MSSHCRACDRKFSNTQALDQHLRDSPVHTSTFECKPCNKLFVNQDALGQHIRDSPAHVLTFKCSPCNKSFCIQDALKQHLRDSAAHRSTVRCDPCKKSFRDQDALDQHLRDSPAHVPTFECDPCNRSYSSQNALDQHLRDSLAHAPAFECGPCNRSFTSQDALEEHLRKARFHRQQVNTPLDNFFRSYPGFAYDPSLPPATSYADLSKYQGWHKGQDDSEQGWESYQIALQAELRMFYGAEDDLTAWHSLCRAIGISPAPKTCARCEEAVRRTHVNIVDLIDWRRGDENGTVRTFDTVEDLRVYTRKTRKIFLNTIGGEDSIVLRHLLRKIFSWELA